MAHSNTYSIAHSQLVIGITVLLLLVGSASAQTVTNRSTDGPTQSGMAPGASAGTYALSGFDNINFANGSLNFRLPLRTIGGRGSAQYTMMLPIERHWSVKGQGHYYSCGGSQICFQWDDYFPDWTMGDKVMPGYGPGVMQGQQTGIRATPCINSSQGFSTTLTLLTFTTPDGSEIQFRDQSNNGQPLPASPCDNDPNEASRGTVFTSVDGSAMTFISDTQIRDSWSYQKIYPTGYMSTRDGTRYRIVNGGVNWIRDRNGNQLSFDYMGGRLISITDSLRRVVTVSYANPSQPYDEIRFSGANGAVRTIRVGSDSTPWLRSDYTPLTWAQAFPELDGTSQWTGGPSPSGPGYVELPDGRRYRFYYNPYGELARVELPTGGAYEYDWASGSGTGSGAGTDGNGGGSVYRRVATRRVYENGGSGSAYTNEMTITRAASSPIATVKVYAPGGLLRARTDHYFYGNPALPSAGPTTYPAWNDNREYQTDYFSEAEVLLRKVSFTWLPRVIYSWAAADPRLIETITTLADTNQVSRQTFSYDQYNNTTDTYEYHFGSGAAGVLVRRAHTDYANLTNLINGLDYSTTDIHMRSLPIRQQVFDHQGILRAQTSYEYDNYDQTSSDNFHDPLTPRSNISAIIGTTGTSPPPQGDYIPTADHKRGNPTKSSRSLLDIDGNETASISSYAQYDVAGNVVKLIDPRSTTANIIATMFDFGDRFGSPDTESRSNTVPSELAETESLMSYAFPTKMTNALGHIAYTQYDYYLGAPVNGEDPNGVVSSTDYGNGSLDLLDRPSRLVRGINNSSVKTQAKVLYNDAARTITFTSDLNTYNDSLIKSETLYDRLGRTTETRLYETSSGYITTKKEYDALGRVKRFYNPYRATTDPTYGWRDTTYDGLSRVERVETFQPNGENAESTGIVTTLYNGNEVTITDQAGKKRKSVTDALGRMSQVYEAPNDPSYNHLTSYEYDVLDGLTRVTQGSQTREFVYDSLKRLKSGTNPESGTVSYQYDNNGNLKEKTDARVPAVTTTYIYDALNRATNRSYSYGTPAVTYTYDAPDVNNSKGRLTGVTSTVSSYSYSNYDELGRVRAGKQTTGDHSYPMSYTYDRAGNIKSQTYPSGRVVTSEFDSAGRLAGVQNQTTGAYYAGAAADTTNAIQYHAQGGIKDMRLGNGLWEHAVFNARLQLTEIGLGTTQGGIERLKLNYDYGTTANNGNLSSQTVTVPTVGSATGFTATQSYSYDALNRLATAQENSGTIWTQNFSYDLYGNRNFMSGTSLPVVLNAGNNPTIDTTNNRLDISAGGQTSVTYDNAGNLTHDVGGLPFGYDGDNKQTTYDGGASANGGASYYYDGVGRRVKKVEGGSPMITTVFVYNVAGQLVGEYSDASATGQGGTSYLTRDMLGSARIITGSSTEPNQGVRARHDYLPFGQELPAGIGSRTPQQGYVGDNVRQKFTSYERDNETELDFAQARYYSSRQGRFTSVDPLIASAKLANPQSWNRYSYVLNRPVSLIDPTGMGDCTPQTPCQEVSQEEANRSSVGLLHETVTINISDQTALETTNPSMIVSLTRGSGQVASDTVFGAGKFGYNTVFGTSNMINLAIDYGLSFFTDFQFGQNELYDASTPGEQGAMYGMMIGSILWGALVPPAGQDKLQQSQMRSAQAFKCLGCLAMTPQHLEIPQAGPLQPLILAP